MTYRYRTQPDAGERAADMAGRGYSGRDARRYVGTSTRPREVEPDEEPEEGEDE